MSFGRRFEVKPGGRVRLSALDPAFTGGYRDEEAAKRESDEDARRLNELHRMMRAEGRRSMLICLQGQDASGKDGAVRHLFRALDPPGARLHDFKRPSEEEAGQDFLLPAHKAAPAKGQIALFNRSHYEGVLIVRVHRRISEAVCSERYDLINSFERNLHLAGTTILKFYLHVSADEQLRRFKRRLDDPSRQWKVDEADYAERARFDDYVGAYEAALERTSTELAPWYVIPSDNKWFRNLAIGRIVVETMATLPLEYPKPRVDIEAIRRKYHVS